MASRITKFSWRSYSLPLIKPLQMMGHQLTSRDGFIIKTQDEDGFIGYGEVAPFPGLHRETLADIAEILPRLPEKFHCLEVKNEIDSLEKCITNRLSDITLPPSLQYGLEMALLNLLANQRSQIPAALLSKRCRRSVSLNGLLTGNLAEMETQLDTLIAEGYSAIKIKVGRKPLVEEIAFVKKAARLLPTNMQIRLDANRAWTFDEAVQFGKRIAACNIAYIEEPLKHPGALAKFYQKTGVPIALDESLNKIEDKFPELPAGTKAIVIKPSVIGGIAKTMRLAKYAEENGVETVISCAFYSGLGLTMAVNIAAAVNHKDIPAGLGTYKWLKKDLLQVPFSANSGKVNLKETWEKAQGVIF